MTRHVNVFIPDQGLNVNMFSAATREEPGGAADGTTRTTGTTDDALT